MSHELRAHDLHVCACGAVLLSGRFKHCSHTCRMKAVRARQAARKRARVAVKAPDMRRRSHDDMGPDAHAKIAATIAAWAAYYRATRRYRVHDGWSGYSASITWE